MTPSCLRLCEKSKRLIPILVFENQTGNESMEISFLSRGGKVPGREAKAHQRDSVVCEQENRCRLLSVVSRGETPRAASRCGTCHRSPELQPGPSTTKRSRRMSCVSIITTLLCKKSVACGKLSCPGSPAPPGASHKGPSL